MGLARIPVRSRYFIRLPTPWTQWCLPAYSRHTVTTAVLGLVGNISDGHCPEGAVGVTLLPAHILNPSRVRKIS